LIVLIGVIQKQICLKNLVILEILDHLARKVGVVDQALSGWGYRSDQAIDVGVVAIKVLTSSWINQASFVHELDH
jgi:hypothetical protein